MRTALARLLDWLAPVLDPEPSTLDRLDRPSRPLCSEGPLAAPNSQKREALCSVIGCPNDPTTAPHGWAVCPAHCPATV